LRLDDNLARYQSSYREPSNRSGQVGVFCYLIDKGKMRKIIGRHQWVLGATISESYQDGSAERRFTATIRGYQNWKIFDGIVSEEVLQLIIKAVSAIREQIDDTGEDCEALINVNKYAHTLAELKDKVEMFENPISKRFDEFLSEQGERKCVIIQK